MTIIIFIIVLAVLVLVHEFGHFITAKWARMRVDEFGLGLPPRALTLFRKGGTDYTLNWIPFGGFVKIYGEDLESLEEGKESEGSFAHKAKWKQALVLVAGVGFNIIFAWLLFSLGFMIGMPTSVDGQNMAHVENPAVTITGVFPDSPAADAGIQAGDEVVGLQTGDRVDRDVVVEDIPAFIQSSDGSVILSVLRDGETVDIPVTPQRTGENQTIGIRLATLGTLTLPVHTALIEGAATTAVLMQGVTVGIVNLIADAITGNADFSQVAGPVGIVGLVGDASALGFVYLLSFTAFISVHLAILNLVPFPALDGGRLVFVLIEKLKGSPVNPRVFQWVNGIGFLFLILLMIIITFNDIARLI
ncbi:MAG: RIP metalloprotease RseP [Candidatus Paceibacterota bacterium]